MKLPILRMPMPSMPSVKAESIDPKLRKPTIGKTDVRAAIMAKLRGGK